MRMDPRYRHTRVRARRDASDDESDAGTSFNPGVSAAIDKSPVSDTISDEGSSESGLEKSDISDSAPENEAASISFGALAKAQQALGKRKRDDGSNDADNSNPKHHSQNDTLFFNAEALERKAGKKDTRDFSRTSKHAPAEVSSKKAVSRKREVVPTRKVDHRDPRFEPLTGPLDEQKVKKNYSFLDTYRDSEMHELKSAIRKTKDPEEKEKMKRVLLSMESRKKSEKLKEQEQEILRTHRKEEKVKIEQGKKPFYLKKSDQKKIALVKRFEGMKGKQVDKVIERRRKKQAAKEKRAMPDARRG